MDAVQHTKELFLKMTFTVNYYYSFGSGILLEIHKVIGNQLVFTSSYGGDVSSSIDGIFIDENVDMMSITLECSFPMSYKIDSILHLEKMFETATDSNTGCSGGNCVSASSDDNQDLNTRLNSAEITYDTSQVPEVGKKFWYTISAPLKMPIRKSKFNLDKYLNLVSVGYGSTNCAIEADVDGVTKKRLFLSRVFNTLYAPYNRN